MQKTRRRRDSPCHSAQGGTEGDRDKPTASAQGRSEGAEGAAREPRGPLETPERGGCTTQERRPAGAGGPGRGALPPRRRLCPRAAEPGAGLTPRRGGCGEKAAAASLPQSQQAEFPGVCTVSNKKRNARSKLIFHPRKEMLLPVLCKAGANSTDTGDYCPFHKAMMGKDA